MSEEPRPLEEGDAPPRRESWSLRTIVRDVSGRTLEEFQDPARQPHPYLRVKPPPGGPRAIGARAASAAAASAEEGVDPVARVYPPLTGAVGRALHGPDALHDAATIGGLGHAGRPSSPSRRPERINQHYQQRHIDRHSDHAHHNQRRAIDEELAHREAARSPPTS